MNVSQGINPWGLESQCDADTVGSHYCVSTPEEQYFYVNRPGKNVLGEFKPFM